MLVSIFFLLHTCSDRLTISLSLTTLIYRPSHRIYLNIFVDNSLCMSSFLCSSIIFSSMLLLQIKENKWCKLHFIHVTQGTNKRTYNKKKQKDSAVAVAGTTSSTTPSENVIKSPIGFGSILTSPNRLRDVKAKLAAPVPVGKVSIFILTHYYFFLLI